MRGILFMAILVVAIVAGSVLSGNTTFTNFENSFLGGDPEVKAATIKIGVYEPISGAYKQYGKDEAAGIELAHDLYPTVLGKDVELIYADNRSNMYDADTALQELMTQNPSIILGSYGEVLSLVASDYLVGSSTPGITVTSVNPLLTINNDFYFTASFSEARQGGALAEYAVRGLNKEAFATVMAFRDDAASAIIQRFEDGIINVTNREDAIVGDFIVNSEDADFTGYIEKLIESGADCVLLTLQPQAAQNFMLQCLEMEYTPQFLGTRDWDTEDFEKFLSSNPDLSVSYPSVQAAAATSTYDVFMKAYYDKYGEDAAEPSGSMAAAFDSYLLAIRAIEDAYQNVVNTDLEALKAEVGTDAKGRALVQTYESAIETGIPQGIHIRDALKEINGFEGATGVLSYEGGTEASKNVTILHFFRGEKLDPYVVDWEYSENTEQTLTATATETETDTEEETETETEEETEETEGE